MLPATSTSASYSEGALRSLQELLEVHGAFLWVDPTTNTLTAKRTNPALLQEVEKSREALQE